jgi:hypothetical protein
MKELTVPAWSYPTWLALWPPRSDEMRKVREATEGPSLKDISILGHVEK